MYNISIYNFIVRTCFRQNTLQLPNRIRASNQNIPFYRRLSCIRYALSKSRCHSRYELQGSGANLDGYIINNEVTLSPSKNKEMPDRAYRRISTIPSPDRARITEVLHLGLLVPPSPPRLSSSWEWLYSAPYEGPSIIASLLKGLGYRTTLLDQRRDLNPDALWILFAKLDVIAIACYPDNVSYLKRSVEIAKIQNPGRPVILGGPLASVQPESLLNDTAADYAVIGEAELTLVELMDHLSFHPEAKPLKDINGLAWKSRNGEIHLNRRRMVFRHLDGVPFQDFSVWPNITGRPVRQIYLSYSRLQHYNSSPVPSVPVAYKSIERLHDELVYYRQHNFREACWNDFSFISHPGYLHTLLDHAFAGLDFRWSCRNMAENADRELYEKMHLRGCHTIIYELITLTPELAQDLRTHDTRNPTVRAILLAREAGIKSAGLVSAEATMQSREEFLQFQDFLSIIPDDQSFVSTRKCQ